MTADIQVEKKGGGEFAVTVSEGSGRTTHTVTLAADYFEKLTSGNASEEELIRRSLEFLLEREPKESILEEFDLPVISRYFPEYEKEIQKRMK